jgi:hypothetical protein
VRDRQAGVVAVLAVFFILAMGAFLALSFNIGLLFKARGELQTAADSAALAAAEGLDGTLAGLDAGRLTAFSFAAAHDVTGQPVRISDQADVRYGFWHFDDERCTYSNRGCARGFEEAPDPTLRPFSITAVLVGNGRDQDPNHNPPLPVIFGAFIARDRPFTLSARAVAVGRRARVDCALPVGLFECADDFLTSGELRCNGAGELDRPLVFTRANLDDLPRVNLLGDGNPNADRVSAQILRNQADCADEDFDTGSTRFTTGGGTGTLRQVVDALLGFDGDDQDGPCLVGATRTLPVLECRSRRGNRRTVVGFVNARVEALTCGNGAPAACPTGSTNPCGRSGGSGASLTLRVLCGDPSGAPPRKPRLMQ